MFIYILVFSLFIKYLADATSRAGTAYPSGAPEFTQGFSGINGARSLVFCVVFCRSLVVL